VIPRYQTVLFFVLLAASIIMGAVLWQLRNRAEQRRLQGQDSTPTQAPTVAPAEQATLMVASDADDSMSTRILSLPLPPSPGARARAVLGKLLDLYAAPGAAHPVVGGASSIAQVFLIPVSAGEPSSGAGANPTAGAASGDVKNGPMMAVVNLTGAFAASHPSGIETESLTVLSICATLHANLPQVTEVRFLVDGQEHETLAGHADLTRTYLTTDAAPAVVQAQP
jgi:Sporulation and spore germination